MSKNHNNLTSRIVGLDIYRIYAIICISTIHFIGYTGIASIPQDELYGINYYLINFLQTFTTTFVDAFVLLSGYFLCTKDLNLKRIVNLWMQVVVIGLLTLLLAIAFSPNIFSITSVLRTLFPLTTRTYWYINCYVLLFIVAPILNRLLSTLEKERLKLTIISIVCIFALIDINPFMTLENYIGGYMSIIWFSLVYMIGGYIRVYGLNVSKWLLFLIALSSYCVLFWINIAKVSLPMQMQMSTACSLLPLCLSCTLFGLCMLVRSGNRIVCRTFSFLSSSTLSVYLIQEQYSFRDIFWNLFDIKSCAVSTSILPTWIFCIVSLLGLGGGIL